MAQRLVTDRLILRTWHIDDAHPALDVFGHVEVARWLSDLWSLAIFAPIRHPHSLDTLCAKHRPRN
jgi:RimJ/RimL family protein N-acetyltransferase